MLRRCAKCGRPLYAKVSASRAECYYCYAKAPCSELDPLLPCELDWRKPLYEAARLMPPETALDRFTFLSDYGHSTQRIDFCKKELSAAENLAGGREDLSGDREKLEGGRENLDGGRENLEGVRENLDGKSSDSQENGRSTGSEEISAFESNPFNVLGATPRSTREELILLQRGEALFGNEAASSDALAALTHPQTHLEAELNWFPLAASEEINALFRTLKTSRQARRKVRFTPAMPSALAQFNMVKLLLSTEPIENIWDLEAHILSLAVLADALFADQAFEEVNEDRKVASYALMESPSQIDLPLKNLFGKTLDHIVARTPACISSTSLTGLRAHFIQSYKQRTSPFHNSYFLELAAERLFDL